MRRRDEQFEHYVRENRQSLIRTATLLAAGDAHLAEDVVQSMLTRLYVSWPAFSRSRNQQAYARRSLVNSLIDEKRRPWRREVFSDAVPERSSTPTGEDDARDTRIHQAMAALPPRMRAAVVLRFYLDLSVEDTADVLNCATGTVKSQTARALDRLRAYLGETAEAPLR